MRNFLLILLPVLLYTAAFASGPPPATVKASSKHLRDGRVAYTYKVINNSKSNIAMVWVGYVFRSEEPELNVMPVGWDFFKGLPKSSCTSPEGWECLVITQEESDYHFMEWSIKESGAVPFKPGKVLKGFTVILPKADDTYLKGNFTVFFDADEPFSSRISN
jgi:hypothetical protein